MVRSVVSPVFHAPCAYSGRRVARIKIGDL
jgi:hypothetical protein